MPLPIRPNCQPTSLGPMPHLVQSAAWDAVMRQTPGLPALPLLPAKGETLPLLGAKGFAGVTGDANELVLEREAARRGIDALYAAYLRGVTHAQAQDLAAVSRVFQTEQQPFRRARIVFGLALGPVSLALTLVDDQTEPVLNDAELLDALAKHVFLRRLWLLKTLERTGKPVAIWMYEPFLDLVQSAFAPLAIAELVAAIDQALGIGMLRVLWAPHAVSAAAILDTLLLDSVGMPLPPPEQAELLAPMIKRLLTHKTAFGWGIVPVTSEGVRGTSVGRLAARFKTWLRALEANGISTEEMLGASLIMPEDTLAYLDTTDAERALALTVELSSLIRQSYGVD